MHANVTESGSITEQQLCSVQQHKSEDFLCVYIPSSDTQERKERQLATSVDGGEVHHWLPQWTVECIALLQESSVAFKLSLLSSHSYWRRRATSTKQSQRLLETHTPTHTETWQKVFPVPPEPSTQSTENNCNSHSGIWHRMWDWCARMTLWSQQQSN